MDKLMEFISHVIKDTGKGLKGYIKSQLILFLITFGILSIGLTIIENPYPLLISLGISILDILPIIGVGIVMIPWSIISFISGNSGVGTNLAIIYIVLILTRQILEPKIMGKEIGVRPIYTFASTILGSIFLGPMGVIIGPLIAVVVSSVLRAKKALDEHKDI